MEAIAQPCQPPASPAEISYAFPLTFAQQRLWFLDRLAPGGTSYNITWTLRLTGSLDSTALEKSLSEIVRRHEVLRTTFALEDGEPVQVIGSVPSLRLRVIDAADEDAAQRLAAVEAREPFDLKNSSLMLRALLLRLAATDHVLVLSTHHIVFDGSSRRVLVRELTELYAAFSTGRPPVLPELSLQYADFAVWQRGHLIGLALEKQVAWWKQQLAGIPAAISLPVDRTRPAVQTFAGAVRIFELPGDLLGQLTAFGKKRDATLFMVLLAGFTALLSRLGAGDDVVVGTAVAGRGRKEIEHLIGLFANTLVLRSDLSGDPTVTELVARVRNMAVGAFARQDLPFEKLVEELQPERSLSYNPVFQVLFSLQGGANRDFELPGIAVRPFGGGTDSAKFDLSVSLTQWPDRISAQWEYNTDLFDRSTIDRMFGSYRTLLQAMVQYPDAKVSELPLLSPAEREQILVEWNATASDYPRERCLHELFEFQVARSPGSVACIFEGEALTYRELNARANRIAHHLRQLGAGPGQTVGIYLERSLGLMAALVGVQKSGAAYVPLDPGYPAERIRVILDGARTPLLLSTSTLVAGLPEQAAQVVCLDRDAGIIAAQSSENPSPDARPGDPVYVIFTSGSTGRPKGVEIPHRAVVNLMTCMARDLAMGPDDVFPALASVAFDMCIPELYLALVTGGCVALAPRGLAGDGEELSKFLSAHGTTVVHATPTTWSLLLDAGFTGRGLKRAIGAEALPRELCRRLLEADPSLFNFYGPTETTVWSAMHHFTDPDEPVVVGRPLANTQIYILDAALRPVPVGVPGEIHIAGDGLAVGYLNQPELTAEKFIPNPFAPEPDARMYKTGDLGRFLPDGRIEFQGRADYQVKVRGFRIELGEIEAVLARHPAVRECVVIAREDVPGDKRLVGYVVADAVPVQELRGWVKNRLPEYMTPVAFVALERFPLTPNGKVDRRGLPEPEYRRSETEGGFAVAGTPAEELIAGIWADVLKLDRVSVEDNFFELGGHSLLGTQVVSRIRDAFHVELPLRALFEAPTVAGMAQHVEALTRDYQASDTPPLVAVARDRRLPLSFAQLRLWFLDQLQPLDPMYNVPFMRRLRGPLHIAVLEASLTDLVQRHESLRTRFAAVDGEPVQVIDANLKPALFQAVAATEEELGQKATEEAMRPFALDTGPLFRATLIRIAADDHVLVLNTHHIVSDGWSLGVQMRDLTAFYESRLAGQPSPLPPLPLQYADFAVWQRNFLSGARLERQLAYWRGELEDAPRRLELPTGRPRPAVLSYHGRKRNVNLPPALLESVREMSRREGVTLYMTLLGALSVLLARYSGQDDVVVGSPIAGRNRVEIENLIGVFINTLVLRTRLAGNPPVRQLLHSIRETTMGAYAHQELPFGRLVEELQPERDLSRNPLFQVMLILQNTPNAGQWLGAAEVLPWGIDNRTAKFDLTVLATEHRDGLSVTFEYNTDLFDRAGIDRMMVHYRTLLEAMVQSPEARVAELPLLSPAEREQILFDWNATARDYPRDRCIHQLFEEQAARTPEREAVISNGRSLSYAGLNARSNQVTHYLLACGAKPGMRIGIRMTRSVEMLAGLLGILKAGAAYVPLDPNFPRERIAFILEDSAASIVLTDDDCVRFDGQPTGNPANGPAPDDLAYVLHTSGSTGRPKGVEITHRNMVNFLASMRREPGLDARDTLVAVTTLSFDIAGLELYLPLAIGAKVVIASREQASDGHQLLDLMAACGATVLQATPATWRMLLDAGWTGTEGFKALCGGEALPAELAAELLPRCGELWNMYGPTETTVWSSIYRVERPPESTADLGKPIANTTMYVLDARMQPVPVGVPGELYIGGEGVARGYLNRPDLTAERFLDDPFVPGARIYRTGDVVRWQPSGDLQYLGRSDFQVKVRGFRIELGEIETVLGRHPGVRECVVVARDERLVGYVVPSAQTVGAAELKAWVKERLPDYMCPAVFVTLDRFPLTPNGKVDRKALPAPEYARDPGEDFIAPRNSLEETLTQIWSELLRVPRISVHDNFFDLGGHSLLAVQLFARIEKVTGEKLPLNILFRSPTISQIAAQMSQENFAPVRTSLRPCRTEGSKPPIYAAHGIGGTVLTFRRLASYLDPNQPVYCLEAFGSEVTWKCLEELAALYVKDVLEFQPCGPYNLIGSSFGGMVVFEMARQLHEQGHEVGFLGMLDTGNMGIRNTWTRKQRARMELRFFYRRSRMHFLRLFDRKLREWPRYSVGRVLAVGRRMQSTAWRFMYRFYKVPSALPAPLLNMKRVYELAGIAYRPKVYAGKITIFLAKDQPRADPYPTQLGWKGWAEQGVEIIEVPGDHNSMNQEGNVQVLAAEMTKCLQRLAALPSQADAPARTDVEPVIR